MQGVILYSRYYGPGANNAVTSAFMSNHKHPYRNSLVPGISLLCIIASFSAIGVEGFESREIKDRSDLIELVQQARNYFKSGKGCMPEFDFDDRMDLVQEFMTITNKEIKTGTSIAENEISIFLERKKPYRPGLSLDMNLKDGRCETFYILEIVE